MRGALRWCEAEIGAQGLSPDVGLVMAVGAKAKTMSKLIKHTDRVSVSF